MSHPLVKLDRVSKTYATGATRALNDVSLEIEAGEFVAILGQSGSGKSTLLRTLNRLVEPSAGRIWLEKEEVTGASRAQLRMLRRRIGMIFQEFNLIDRATVMTNVLCGRLGTTPSFWAWINRFSATDMDAAMTHLERMGLAREWDRRADRLSGGQRQRVGIARALMQKPKLLMADEPVASLDPASAESILDHLKTINQQDGVTVLCNLHQPELARRYASRVLGLCRGDLIYDGPVAGLNEGVLNQLYGTACAA